MKGDPVAANLKLSGGLRGDRWRGALSELKLKTPLRRWELSAPGPSTSICRVSG